MKQNFGPWSTAINTGNNPQLSTFWKRRLNMLLPISHARPRISRRSIVQLVVIGIAMLVLPTIRVAEKNESSSFAQAQDIQAQPQFGEVAVPSRRIRSLVFSQDGRIVYGGSSDGTIKLFNPQDGRVEHMLIGHTTGVKSIDLSPDGRSLASGSAGGPGTIKLWDLKSRQIKKTLAPGSDHLRAITYSSRGDFLASVHRSRLLKIWDLKTGKVKQTIKLPGICSSVAVSPDGKTLATGFVSTEQARGSVRLWDARTGNLKRSIEVHRSSITAVTFSPDGKTVAAGGYKWAKLWDTQTGELKQTFSGLGGLVEAVVYSPDGRILAVGGQGPWRVTPSLKTLLSEIRLWNVQTGELLLGELGESGRVISIAFSPEGKSLVFCDYNSVIKMDIETGNRLWSHTYK